MAALARGMTARRCAGETVATTGGSDADTSEGAPLTQHGSHLTMCRAPPFDATPRMTGLVTSVDESLRKAVPVPPEAARRAAAALSAALLGLEEPRSMRELRLSCRLLRDLATPSLRHSAEKL